MTWAGRPRGWARLRILVLVRDGYRCQIEGCPTPDVPADSINHRTPRKVRIDHSLGNLEAAHTSCNSRIGARELPAANISRRWLS